MNIWLIMWLIVLPSIILAWVYLINELKNYASKVSAMPHNPYPKIIFLYATREINPVIIKASASIPVACEKVGFNNYEIVAVTSRHSDTNIPNVKVFDTPDDYKCKSNFKARQLNYVLQYLPNSKDTWILHLDEDAKILPQTVMAIISYIKNGGKPVADGATYFPYIGNIWTTFIEAQRFWTYCWVKFQLRHNFVCFMNGSNMLIRSDVEHVIGWDFPNIKFSEDTRFAYEASKQLGNVFGWHGGITIEQPPKTVSSAIKQRIRWFYGGILQFKHAPLKTMGRRLYSQISWFSGFILTCLLPLGLIGVINAPTGGHLILAIILGVLWILRYQIGLYLNNQYSQLSIWKKILIHIVFVPLMPIIDFICTIPTILAFTNPPKSFVVTEK